MTTNEPADAGQPWGAQPPPDAPQRPKWSGKKTAAAVAIAVVIAAGGGAAIYAATSNDSGNQQGGPGRGGPGGFPGGFGGPNDGGQRFGAGALAEALHGEFVIADGSTELLQNGQVTSINDTSIAVKSTDGYTKTYTIDSSTMKDNDIQNGDQVLVIAKQAGTAISVIEPGAMRGGNGRPQQQQPPTSR